MALWVDKYRPHQLKDISYHTEQATQLSVLVKSDDFPHLLVYGPNGAGKKTRIHCVLRELYGLGADKLRLGTQEFTATSGKKLEIQTVSSNYHIELSPSDVGIYDRVVVQDVVKSMAQSAQLDTSQRPFKVVVLMEVDQLTMDAQHALRRTMEKFSANCRLILCCEHLSRVIDPLLSRCLAIRIAAPTEVEIRSAIQTVSTKESLSIDNNIVDQIIEKSRGNMRRALLMLEASKIQNKVAVPEWETYIRETAELIIAKQNSETVMAVRQRLYEVLSRCIPPSVVFSELLRDLLPFCTPAVQAEAVAAAAEFEHRLTRGQKAIFHLEAFVVTFMDIYLQHQKQTARN